MNRSPGQRLSPAFARIAIPLSLRVVLGLTCLVNADSLHARTWENFTYVRSVQSAVVLADTVWLGTTGGLVHFPLADPADDTRLTNADGLGDNDIRFTVADSLGTLWTGGQGGRLSHRLADQDWRVYQFQDGDGLPVPLNAAAPGPDGILWVASDQGVHKFDTQRHGGELKETYNRIGTWSDLSIVSAVAVSGGLLWAVGESGVARAAVDDDFLLIPDHWQTWSGLGPLTAVAQQNTLTVVAGDSGMFVFAPVGAGSDSGWVRVESSPDGITALHVVGDTIWTLAKSGLFACNGNSCEPVPIPGAIPTALSAIAGGDDGSLWLGEDGLGAWYRRGGIWQSQSFPGPLHSNVSSVAVGKDGKVWCVYPTTGATYFENGAWTSLPYYTVGPSGPGEMVTVAPNGDVWLAAFGSGAFRVDPADPLSDGHWTRFDTTNSSLDGVEAGGVPSNYVVVTQIVVSPEGRVWLANNAAMSGPVIAFNDNDCWGAFDAGDGVLLPGLRTALTVFGRSVLIGTAGEGLLELKHPEPLCSDGEPLPVFGQVTAKDTRDGLPSNDVTAILFDQLDSLWVGTSLGLVKWSPRFRQFLDVDLPAEAGLLINALAVDGANGIWVGTSLGLVHIDAGGTTTLYNAQNSGLVGGNVRDIAVDTRTRDVWIATTTGLSRTQGPPLPAAAPDETYAYPNPVVIDALGEPHAAFNAPAGSRVIIYTVDGRKVTDFESHLGWDCRSQGGRFVASGVYLFVVEFPDGTFGRGKLAVFNRR